MLIKCNIKLPEQVLAAARIKAKAEGRSLNAYLIDVVAYDLGIAYEQPKVGRPKKLDKKGRKA